VTAQHATTTLHAELLDVAAGAEGAKVAVRGWQVLGVDPVGTVSDLRALAAVADACGWRDERDPDGPPFAGGAIGFITDDVSPPLLELAADDRRRAPLPLEPMHFAVYDTALCQDPSGRVQVVAADVPGWTREPAAVRAARWEERVAAMGRPGGTRDALALDRQRARPSLDAAAHRAAVGAAQAMIAAGDLYQLNLTLQLAVDWPHGGKALARRLWAASPGAAHAAWLRTGDVEVVSVSPETFLATDADRATTRPIKGTRPRRVDRAADQAEAAALQASAKDAAEHVMIVDLARNDLGRVCVTGTVRVPELAALEAHPTVWHLTSTVRGRLRPEVGLDDLLAATFPPGSVTGAPKRMAWSRIRELEPVRRGVYCGAIGVVTRGLVDLSVAIRTAVVGAGVASYGAGGGIVADSDPAAEHAEALDKAAAFLTATNATPPA
jgi:para-aminobenzoate synthetase component 1